jgi:transposase
VRRVFDGRRAEDLKALLHRSPRDFGKPTGVWTLDLAADVSVEQGLTPVRVSDETVRQALKRLGVGWKRAKTWITSPDPAYTRKKEHATD